MTCSLLLSCHDDQLDVNEKALGGFRAMCHYREHSKTMLSGYFLARCLVDISHVNFFPLCSFSQMMARPSSPLPAPPSSMFI